MTTRPVSPSSPPRRPALPRSLLAVPVAMALICPCAAAMPGGWGWSGPTVLVLLAAWIGAMAGYASLLGYSLVAAFRDGPRRLLWRLVASALLILGTLVLWEMWN